MYVEGKRNPGGGGFTVCFFSFLEQENAKTQDEKNGISKFYLSVSYFMWEFCWLFSAQVLFFCCVWQHAQWYPASRVTGSTATVIADCVRQPAMDWILPIDIFAVKKFHSRPRTRLRVIFAKTAKRGMLHTFVCTQFFIMQNHALIFL